MQNINLSEISTANTTVTSIKTSGEKTYRSNEDDIFTDSERILEQQQMIVVLRNVLKQMETIVHLPKLLQNGGKLLQSHISAEDIKMILKTCEKYSNSKEDQYSESFDDEKENTKEILIEISDPNLSNIVALLTNNNKIQSICTELLNGVDEPAITFLYHFRYFIDTAIEKLCTSFHKEKENEHKLNECQKRNDYIKEEFTNLSIQYSEMMIQNTFELNEKNKLLNECKKYINMLNEEFKRDVYTHIMSSEKHLEVELEYEHEIQRKLEAELNVTTRYYQQLLRQNLNFEKKLKEKKLEKEDQLKKVIEKYDTEMTEKLFAYESMKKAYEDDVERFASLQKHFEEQEIEYKILMIEKAEEEQKEFDEKCYQFLLKRSVKRIQKYWREYRERKMAKKKSKRKGKGAKKDVTSDAAKIVKNVSVSDSKPNISSEDSLKMDFISVPMASQPGSRRASKDFRNERVNNPMLSFIPSKQRSKENHSFEKNDSVSSSRKQSRTLEINDEELSGVIKIQTTSRTPSA